MPPGAPQSQEPDNSFAPMWIIIGLFILFLFIWYYFRVQITTFVVAVKSYEIMAMSYIIPADWAGGLRQATHIIKLMQAAGYQEADYNDLIRLSGLIGNYLRYPAIVILFGLGVLVYVMQPINRFKKTYTMQRLIEAERNDWPNINPIVNVDLVHEDINKGPWAMAMAPVMFAKYHKLIIEEKVLSSDATLKSKANIIVSINRDEARRIFSLQLGPYWIAPEALSPHAKALFSVFAARIEGDRKSAAKLLEQINRSVPSGKLDFSGVDELLKRHKDSKIVQKICHRHAFALTVMASMLETARGDGVIACAEFLWLKPLDRRLWFTLNNVGKQTPFTEAAGIFAHWLAEKEFGRKLNVPMVEEAVNGLAEAMKEIIYKP